MVIQLLTLSFKKNITRLITYSSQGNELQIDYIQVKISNRKNIKNRKVVSSEEHITQHITQLVCDLIVSAKPVKPIHIPPRRKAWKLTDTGTQQFEQRVTTKCQTIPAGVENSWKSIKNGLLEAADEIRGWMRGAYQQHKETFWWDKTVDNAIKVKREAWKQWKSGGSKEEYLRTKRAAKAPVYFPKKDAQAEQFPRTNKNSDKN